MAAKKEHEVARDPKVRSALFKSEAQHVIGHVRQRGGHNRNERGYCIDCINMIEGALEWAYKLGTKK